MAKKLTKEQEAKIYCIKNGHANYVWSFWGEVYCGRCGSKVGDRLCGIYDLTDKIIVGCKKKNCKVCPPLIKNLSPLDKKIFRKLSKAYKEEIPNHEKILEDIDFNEKTKP